MTGKPHINEAGDDSRVPTPLETPAPFPPPEEYYRSHSEALGDVVKCAAELESAILKLVQWLVGTDLGHEMFYDVMSSARLVLLRGLVDARRPHRKDGINTPQTVAITEDQAVLIESLASDAKELLPKRNMVVHGEWGWWAAFGRYGVRSDKPFRLRGQDSLWSPEDLWELAVGLQNVAQGFREVEYELRWGSRDPESAVSHHRWHAGRPLPVMIHEDASATHPPAE